ncbi:MAG TPA: hypothetical protein PLY42_14375, partial [Nitrospira sp.]|nr:hypothetical protein [Nitrospira sp.]HMX92558.1 hypothetical protein [Nitrospira sp.]HMZ56610.1 hypothetical protein [Nitrospira sp.]HNG04628.1 hypothetical protein [Nitrospira sp.]
MAIVMAAQLHEIVTLAGGGELEEEVAKRRGGFVGEPLGEASVTAAAHRSSSMASCNSSSG